jgi:hypothetical protein
MSKVIELGKDWWTVDRAQVAPGKKEAIKKARPRKSVRETHFFTPKQLAEKFGLCTDTIRDWIRCGLLDAQPLPQGYRIADYAVEEFLESQRTKGAG